MLTLDVIVWMLPCLKKDNLCKYTIKRVIPTLPNPYIFEHRLRMSLDTLHYKSLGRLLKPANTPIGIKGDKLRHW
jgi:hypothetical protein